MEKKKDVTIYDLAQELGVSPSTVSRALNDHASIGKKTKIAVRKLAESKGYRPNTFASSLRTNQSNTIGILVSWINRPFISSLISGIEKAARDEGYHVIISQSHDKSQLEKENLQTMYDSRVSAMIISLAMETVDYRPFELFTKKGIPIVFVDRIPTAQNTHKVHINNFRAAFDATEHLFSQGCKRIAHYGGSRHQAIYEERRSGYIAALKKNNLSVDESIILEAESLSSDEGTRLTEHVLGLQYPPDGIFCANDTAAVSAIHCAKTRGIRIPEELAIIGFNDDPICTIIEPTLSSVHHPAVEMGKAAVQEVMVMLKNDSPDQAGADQKVGNGLTNLILDTSVVMRASSNRLRT